MSAPASMRIPSIPRGEANLDSYMADLHLSSAYQEALRAGFINGMEERIQLSK